MQIKRFEAKNMTAALRMVKGELGPEAVILSARSLRKGKGFFGSLKYAGVEVTAAIDVRETQISNTPSVIENNPYAKLLNSESLYNNSAGDPVNGSSAGYAPQERSYQKVPLRKNKIDPGNHRVLSSVYQHILAQGVDRTIASELIDEIKRSPVALDYLTNDHLKDHLCAILEEKGVWADKNAFAIGKPHIVALIGTTGVGKTTTIAKLAAVQTSRRQKQVALITIDNMGVAANEPLKRFARIMGIPLMTAVSPLELKQAVKKLKTKDLILIDTPGLNPTDRSQIHELKSYFTKLPEMQKHLVVSATTKEADLVAISQNFKEIGFQRWLFTKIDESGTLGNMINVLIRTNIPLSFLCGGRKVPDDIETGSIQKLVDWLLPATDSARRPSTNASIGVADGSAEDQDRTRIQSYFVANKNSDVYHTQDCKWSHKIKPDNIVEFVSIQEAEAHNFLPCRSCSPQGLKNEGILESRTAAQQFSSYR